MNSTIPTQSHAPLAPSGSPSREAPPRAAVSPAGPLEVIARSRAGPAVASLRESRLRRLLFCMCVLQLHREWRWALYVAAMFVGLVITVACIMNSDRMNQSQIARFVQARLLVPVKLAP